MATEPMSLGLRFRRHVAGWVMDSVPTPPPGELEALEARADAAERLARATDAFDAFCAGLDVQDARGTLLSLMRNLGPVNEALAAWRALGEVDG